MAGSVLDYYLRCIISTSVRERGHPQRRSCGAFLGVEPIGEGPKLTPGHGAVAAAYGASHRNRSPVHGKRMQCRKYRLCCPHSRRSHPPSDSCLSKTGLLTFLWSRLPRPSHYTIILAVLLLAHQERRREEEKKKDDDDDDDCMMQPSYILL